MTTLLVGAAELDGERVVVEGDAFHHFFRARRLAAGERLRLTDGAGRARWATVSRVGRGKATLELGDAAPRHRPAVSAELVVATPRPPRAAWLVEKATELGVSAVRFVITERASRRLGAGAMGRLRRVARGALEQSGGSCLPQITGPHGWHELGELLAPAERRWLLLPGAPASWPGLAATSPAAVAVGPEGGWTADETARLEALGCVPAGLGPRILRIETAALAAAVRILVSVSVDTHPGPR